MPEGFGSKLAQKPNIVDTISSPEATEAFYIKTEDQKTAKQIAFRTIIENLLREAGSGSTELDPKGVDVREYHNRAHSEGEVLEGARRVDDVLAIHHLLDPHEQLVRDIAAAGHDIVQMGYSDLFPEFETGPDGRNYLGLPGRRRRKIAQEPVFEVSPRENDGTNESQVADALVGVYRGVAEGKLTVQQIKDIGAKFRNIGATFLNEEETVRRVGEILTEVLPRFTFGSSKQKVFTEEEIADLTPGGSSFKRNIEDPIMATKPHFAFHDLTDEQVSEALPELRGLTLDERKRYLKGIKISQSRLDKTCSPQQLAVGLADLKEVYKAGNSKDAFIESGNKEYQETRHAELVQLFQYMAGVKNAPSYPVSGGNSVQLPISLEDTKTYYALDIIEWVRGQVDFAIWQRTDAVEKITKAECLQRASDPQAVRRDLLDLYDFETQIRGVFNRDQELQANSLSTAGKAGHYQNKDILKLLEYVGVKENVLKKLCTEAGVTVEQILEADSQK